VEITLNGYKQLSNTSLTGQDVLWKKPNFKEKEETRKKMVEGIA